MTLRKLGLLMALCASSIAVAPSAIAAPAFSVSGTPTTLANPPFTLGYAFTLAKNFTLTAVGVFDEAGDGLLNSYDIGLFDSGGAVIASTNLGAGTSGTLVDGFRYVDLVPFALAAGDYRIGAVYTNNAGFDSLYFAGGANTITAISGVSYGGARFGSGAGLNDPTAAAGDGGYFGPNFLLGSAAVPEPATWAFMIVGFGGIGGVMRRRQRGVAGAVRLA